MAVHSTMNGAEFHYSILDEAQNFITNQESDMHNSVEGRIPVFKAGAVKVLGGWVGQIYLDEKVVWQSKKLRNDKETKHGDVFMGSDVALQDAYDHYAKKTKERFAS